MFRFYLNNQIVSDPINWDDFTETIERDDTIKGVLPKYEQKLTFTGGGCKLLSDLKRINGFCTIVDLRVDQKIADQYETILNGYIFIADCEFNLNKNTVECPVQDNNYSAMIYNNKSIDIYLDSTLSKNAVPIPACETKNVTFFTPSTGNDAGAKKMYPVWSAFKYVIDFISDGAIDFESDYLDYTKSHTGNLQRGLTISTGAILRGGTNNISPKISFDVLFKEIYRKFPIAFTILTQSNGRQLIKIEEESYFYGESSGVVINNIQDLKESINTELLYSEIAIGGQTAAYDPAKHTVPDTNRMFFQKESYYYQTKCNIDKKLDLTTNFICDSNIIEELVATNTSNNGYDEQVFLVQVTYSSGILGNRAIKTSLGSNATAPYYYNANLTNAEVSKNFNIYSDLIQYISNNNIGFQASKTAGYSTAYHVFPTDYNTDFSGRLISTCTVPALVTFEDDTTSPNNDPGNNYTLNSRYTSPSPGHYYFSASLLIRMAAAPALSIPNVKVNFTIQLRRYDSSNVLQETHTQVFGGTTFNTYFGVSSTGEKYLVNTEKMFFMQTGDYVQVYFSWCSLPWRSYDINGYYDGSDSGARAEIMVGAQTFFKTLSTESNGILVSGNTSNYYAGSLKFEFPLPHLKYKTLKADLSKSLTVNHDGSTNKTGWIQKSVRTLSTGKTTWELLNKDI